MIATLFGSKVRGDTKCQSPGLCVTVFMVVNLLDEISTRLPVTSNEIYKRAGHKKHACSYIFSEKL